MLWSHEPIAPWQDEIWIEQMRRLLRPSAFQRLILNQCASAESAFLEAEMVDACTDPNLRPVIYGDSGLELFVGVMRLPDTTWRRSLPSHSTRKPRR